MSGVISFQCTMMTVMLMLLLLLLLFFLAAVAVSLQLCVLRSPPALLSSLIPSAPVAFLPSLPFPSLLFSVILRLLCNSSLSAVVPAAAAAAADLLLISCCLYCRHPSCCCPLPTTPPNSQHTGYTPSSLSSCTSRLLPSPPSFPHSSTSVDSSLHPLPCYIPQPLFSKA